ncbi:MAG: NAD(FAD)-utilizing dehydrogenase [Myxococcales bacterium]|nr:NAD(FAD)-utilizing dehydrogenase [Myxococcales bacterium]
MLQTFAPLDEPEPAAMAHAARVAGYDPELVRLTIVRRSLDARKGHPIGFHLEIAVWPFDAVATDVDDALPAPTRARAGAHVIVVGTGPCGTYAALRLCDAGARVTLVELGKAVQPRRHDLAALTQRGALDPDSNYCFGEGGAGTFSDGKLYTRTKDRRAVRSVLRALVTHGADPEILVESRPHVGSNRLPKILMAQRADLEARGATYVWSDGVSDLLLSGNRVCGVRCASGRELTGDAVILAVGHSARRLYTTLHTRGVALEAKGFAVGARVEHAQPLIDRIQYGRDHTHPRLPAAFYHLTATVPTPDAGDRGVYSFCMCPGGWVVDSSTEEGALCVNGMSLKRRDSPFANAALVVTVEPRDYLGRFGDGPLAGIELQRALERSAFEIGGGAFVAPAQRLTDFVARRPTETALPSSYRPSVIGGDVRATLLPFVGDALERALAKFQRTMPGFMTGAAQLIGVETRTSSPVRIVRSDGLVSPTHPGLYPAGEGAGYAGGIVSAAVDGMRVADAVIAAL